MTVNAVVLTTGPLLSLDEAKAHLNVTFDDDDDLINTYIDAAVASCLRRCDRALVPVGAEPIFKAAALLLIGDLYANRTSISVGDVVSTLPTMDALLWDYRLIRV